MRPELVDKFIKKSLTALQLNYLDLYLIHGPTGFIAQHDLDLIPRDCDGNVVLDTTTDLVKVWKVI